MRTHRVVLIPGDGIGPELVDAARRVVGAAEEKPGGFRLGWEVHEAGARYYQKTGERISAATLQACREAGAILKGPAGDPSVRNQDGTEAGVLGGVLRMGLDLFANVRPIKLWPGVEGPLRGLRPGEVDYVIVRENTEGIYASRDLGVVKEHAAADTLLMTRAGVERVVRFAFELARRRGGAPRDGVRRVTCVDKSNVLRSFAFFRKIFREVGEEYADVEKDYLYADAAAQALILKPGRFDVLVMENLLGDLLSDLGAATVGGLGMCPSGNYGERAAYFEPIHGSAPSLAGADRANPLSQVLSAAMMLEKLGEAEAARAIEAAAWRALAEGKLTIGRDGCPHGGTRAAAEAVAACL